MVHGLTHDLSSGLLVPATKIDQAQSLVTTMRSDCMSGPDSRIGVYLRAALVVCAVTYYRLCTAQASGSPRFLWSRSPDLPTDACLGSSVRSSGGSKLGTEQRMRRLYRSLMNAKRCLYITICATDG